MLLAWVDEALLMSSTFLRFSNHSSGVWQAHGDRSLGSVLDGEMNIPTTPSLTCRLPESHASEPK